MKTMRVHNNDPGNCREHIGLWCLKHLSTMLPVTNEKDYGMVELWDDRCVQVIPNTGERADDRE